MKNNNSDIGLREMSEGLNSLCVLDQQQICILENTLPLLGNLGNLN